VQRDTIGEIEVERLKESRSMGGLKSRKSYALEIATKPLVMASEISGLEPLRGFIKQENRVIPVRFRLAKKRKKQPEFVERKVGELTPRPTPATSVPQPLAVAPELVSIPNPSAVPQNKPLQSVSPAPEKPKAIYVWDESKGID
jgi:hypothetical protein